MQFAQYDNLLSLLVLAPMLAALVGYWVWKRRLMERVGDHSMLAAMAAASSSRRQIASAVLALLGTLMLCLAVAQPQWGQTNQPIRRTGVDIVFALDLSQSMMAEDVSPNRLRAAKDEIEKTLEMLEGDRVGLVVFTAVSFVQSPLTIDYGAIRFYLDKLHTDQMPMGGTSIGRALADAIELLTGERQQEGADAPRMRRAKSQLIVLITDGEDHESDPIAAAELARSHGIEVVTVGIGSTEGERIPIHRPGGQLAGYKRDRAGNVVKTHLDKDTLVEIAKITGGTFVHYSGVNSVANEIVSYVNALEKSEIETLMRERYRERFGFFLVPGLVFLVLSLMLGDRRRIRRRTRPGVAAAAALVLLFAGSACERAFEDTQSAVDRGNERLEAGDFQGALDMYRLAEKQIPARPELHYDIGRALLGLEQWDDAADAFARALETSDPSLQFDALYNLGLAHAGKESWREAWESFGEAILVAERSGAIDDERLAAARHNLEVAWLRLHPPCRTLEDAHEDNDTADSATSLQKPAVKGATLCGLDDDWYVIGAIPGTRVEVTARFHDLRENPDPETAFLPKNPDLQIAVFDQTGQTAIAVDQGLEAEPPSGRTATRTIARFLVDESMVSAQNPHVLLRVGAAEHLEFTYDVEIVSIPPCHALEEDAEDNDAPEQAKALAPGNHTLHSCPGDEDWFAVDVEAGDSIFVDLRSQPDPERETAPSLALEIFTPDGEVVAPGEPDGAFVTAGVRDVREPTRFLVHVFGATDNEQGPYLLDLYRFAPCIVGDDRFEQNDTAAAAALLGPKQPVQRYLRACDQDADFYRIDFPEDAKDKRLNLGLAHISTPAPGSEPTEPPQFEFDQVSESGDQILVAGARVEFPNDAEKPQIPLALLVQNDAVEGQSAFVRVAGASEFYHLVSLEPPQSNPDDKSQQSEEQQEQQSDQKKPGESEQQQGDEQKEQADQSQGSEEPQPGDEGDKDPQAEEQKDGSAAEPKEEQPGDEERKRAAQTGPEEVQMERIEDLLEALEQTDDNFQMRKALENMPGRYIEKDW